MATGVMVAGIALQTFSQLESNKKQAKANKANAEYYEIQKRQAEAASRRAVDIFQDESDAFIGDQMSAFAKAGIDMSGSALLIIAGTKAAHGREENAIRADGASTANLASIKAREANDKADYLGGSGLKALTLANGALGILGRTLPKPKVNVGQLLSRESLDAEYVGGFSDMPNNPLLTGGINA